MFLCNTIKITSGLMTHSPGMLGFGASYSINNWNIDRKFHPEMKEDEREEKLAGWEKAVKYSFGWAKN